jgi:hypothetical protein
MPPEKYDIMFAMKAIGLSEQLSGSDKQVAFAILDHYNKGTGRCDPSRETLSKLLNISPRTVSRSICKLTETRLFKVDRHGGHYNCNSYQPNWRVYRELESVWKKRRVACSRRYDGQEVAPKPSQDCPLPADEPVYQTTSSNYILTTSAEDHQTSEQADKPEGHRNGARIHSVVRALQPQWPHSTSSTEAAKAAAEKRWNAALIDRYSQDVMIYGKIIEAMTPQLQEGATQAEMQRRGSGLFYLIKELSSLIPGRTSVVS